MNSEIIVVEQLPIIKQQLQTIKAEVTARVGAALSLECTEKTVKYVKEARAGLNADFKYWEDRRKQVKSAIMSPYEQFEAVYKDCVTEVFKKADAELKQKIDSVEDKLKAEKRQELQAYFDELCVAAGIDFLTLEAAKISITLSASMKSLKEMAKAFVDRVCDDLTLIETQEHKEEILFEYKKNLNVAHAVAYVNHRHKAIEAEKAREAERLAREQAMREAAAKVEHVAETLAPAQEVVTEKPLTVQLTVTGTRAQLKALKDFLNKGGYEYR